VRRTPEGKLHLDLSTLAGDNPALAKELAQWRDDHEPNMDVLGPVVGLVKIRIQPVRGGDEKLAQELAQQLGINVLTG
jgi:hypothetical protein